MWLELSRLQHFVVCGRKGQCMVNVPEYDLKNAVSGNRLQGLLRILTGFRLKYIGAIASLAVATIAKTATFLLLAYFVDTVLTSLSGQADNATSGQTVDMAATLAGVALGLVVLALVEGVFSFQSGRLAARTGEGVAFRLRNYLYDHLQRLSFSYHDRMQTGELIQRCTSDVDAIRRFFAEQTLGVGRIITFFAINLTAIMLINVPLALLSVIAIPLMVLMSFFFFKKVEKVYEAFQEQDAVLSTTMQEKI